MKPFHAFLFVAAITGVLCAQTPRAASTDTLDNLPEITLRVRPSDPVGFCSPASADHAPSLVLSAASGAIFTCDLLRGIWAVGSAPPDTRRYDVSVTEYQYVQGTDCNPTANPACNVIHLAQLSGAGTVFQVQAVVTPFDGNNLISFECDGEAYPGENTDFATFFMEAFQTTDWKSRNIGGNVAIDGVGSYRDVMVPFTSGCAVDVTNESAAASQVFTQIEYASGPTPPVLTGGTRNHYHMAHDHAAGITPYAVHTCLNYSGVPGEIESVISAFAPEYSTPVYLEGDPSFTLDSNTDFHYSATEDFFGSQWYFQLFQDTSVSDKWEAPNAVQSASQVEAYRFFTGPHETYTRITWNNSVSFNQPNGQIGQGQVQPAPLDHNCLVTFWTVK